MSTLHEFSFSFLCHGHTRFCFFQPKKRIIIHFRVHDDIKVTTFTQKHVKSILSSRIQFVLYLITQKTRKIV